MINIIFYALIPVVIIALLKDFLLFDEEVILIISVLIFLGASYNIISGFLVSSLAERADAIKKSFDNFFNLKINTLNTLVSTYQKVYETNNELIKVIGVTSKNLELVKDARAVEVEQFLSYVVNQHLQNVLMEELNLIKNVYVAKIQQFFSELNFTWKLQELKDILTIDEQQNFDVVDEVEKATKVINFNKLELLPLSTVSKNDLYFLSNFTNVSNILQFVFSDDDLDVVNYFIFLNLLNVKVVVK